MNVLQLLLIAVILTIVAFTIDVSTGLRVVLVIFALAFDAAVIYRFVKGSP